jgi:chromosome segregation ATPase
MAVTLEEKQALLQELLQERELVLQYQKDIQLKDQVIAELKANSDKLQKSLEDTQRVLFTTQKRLTDLKKKNDTPPTSKESSVVQEDKEKLTLRENNRQLERKVQELNQIVQHLQNSLEEEKFNVELGNKTIGDLHLQLSQLRSTDDSIATRTTNTFTNELTEHDLFWSTATATTTDISKLATDVQRLEQSIAEERHTSEVLRKQLEEEKQSSASSQNPQLEAKLKRTEKQLEALKQGVAADAQRHQSNVMDLNARITHLMEENNSLTASLNQRTMVDTDSATLQSENLALKDKLKEEQMRYMEALMDIKEEKIATDQLKHQLEKCRQESKSLLEQVSQLQNKVANTTMHDTLMLQLAQEKEKFEVIFQQNTQLKSNLHHIQAQHEDAIRSANLDNSSHLNRIEETHKMELARLSTVHSTQISDLRDQLNSLHQNFNEVNLKCGMLQDQLALCKQEKESIELNLEEERANKGQLLNNVKEEASAIQNLTEQLKQCSSAYQHEQQLNQELQLKLDKLLQEIVQERAHLLSLTEDNATSKQNLQQLEELCNNLKNNKVDLEKQNQDLAAQVQTLTHNKEVLQDQLEAIHKELKTERDYNILLGSDIKENKLLVDKLKTQLENSVNEKMDYKSDQELQVIEELTTLKKQVTVLTKNLQEEKDANTRLLTKISEEHAMVTSITEQRNKLTQLCEETQTVLELAHKKHQDEIQQLTTELDNLRSQLQHEKDSYVTSLKQIQQEKLSVELSTIESLKEQINELRKICEVP